MKLTSSIGMSSLSPEGMENNLLISSNVLFFVSGRYFQMKTPNPSRKTMKMRKEYGPVPACNERNIGMN